MRNYKEIFKQLIASEVGESNNNKEFIDSLYNKVRDKTLTIATSLGHKEVDEHTLKNYFNTAKNEYLSVNPIDPGLSYSLTKKDFKTWLTDERKNSLKGKWSYSDRYWDYLEESGRSNKVIEEIKNSSYSILQKLEDPECKTESYRKGLVVGAVQSGKTGNFNAVINRAIDSGYKLIIVLAGIMEDLRSQTQDRIEKDVIGEGKLADSEAIGPKGVGHIHRFGVLGESNIQQVDSATSIKKDFGRIVKDMDKSLNGRYVLVCKKNVSILRNLIVWLHNSLGEGKNKHNIPFLIIDDEADNASLNNLGYKGKNYATKTNEYIRAILNLFYVKSYLGYTATPFANVLQDRNESPDMDTVIKYKLNNGEEIEKKVKLVDNIFPDDFIELLTPPSNYVGAKQIFETVDIINNLADENEKIPLVAPPVDDHVEEFPSRLHMSNEELIGVENITSKDEWDDRFGFEGYLGFDTYSEYRKGTDAATKDDNFPKKLPESLKTAIKCFVIALAIREYRKPGMMLSETYQPHNTMLVHISRFTLWQNKTKTLIQKYINEIISRLKNDKPKSPNSIYYELEQLWYSENGFAHIVENIKLYLPKGYEDEFMTPLVFDSLVPNFIEAVSGLEVKAINSLTKDSLVYPKNKPKKIIAVGGNRLSRGFTLEGLTINYFIRVTNYSDALLQMGRWFGYRPGYLDCCKIFTTHDSYDKFNSTTKCIEELESEFVKMESQGKTPREFNLRVKKHPSTLKITRPSILKNAKVVNWSYQDSLQMTTVLKVDKTNIEKIWNNFKNNIAPKFQKISSSKDVIYYSANSNEIVSILSQQPNNFLDSDPDYMTKFIKLCNKKGYLTNWTIGLKITGASKPGISKEMVGLNENLDIPEIFLAKRSGPNRDVDIIKFINQNQFRASSKSANIITSNNDMSITLTNSEKEKAKEKFYETKSKEILRKNDSLSMEMAELKARKSKTIPESYYRELIKETDGLLMIYLFDSKYAFNQEFTNNKDLEKKEKIKAKFKNYIVENDIDIGIPLVGYAIEFPPLQKDPGGVYYQGDYDLNVDEDIDDENEINDEIEGIDDFNDI